MRVYQFRHVGTGTALQLKLKRRNRTDYGAILVLPETAEITSGRVVPTEGLEPPHLAAHGPEPCASTNSATWALVLLYFIFTASLALPPTSAIILAFGFLR